MQRTVADGSRLHKLRDMGEHLPPALQAICQTISPRPRQVDRPDLIETVLFAATARRHQVESLVAQRLQQRGMALSPALAAGADRAHRAALRQMAAAIALQQLLRENNIACLFLKGLPLAQRAFGSTLLRQAVDIDVLIDRGQVSCCWDVLAAAGYVAVTPGHSLPDHAVRRFTQVAKDSLHRDPVHGVPIELHWRMADELADNVLPPRDRWQTVAVSSRVSLDTLCDEDLFVLLVVHGAAHGWARLKWLADIAALLSGAADGGATWWQYAQRKGAGIAAASAILLANRLLGMPYPPGFTRPRSVRLTMLLRLSLALITAGDGAKELEATAYRGWAEMAAKLLVAQGWPARRAVLRRFAWSGQDIAQLPLRAGFDWLYPLLRLPLLVRRRLDRSRQRRKRLRPHGQRPNTPA